MKKKPAAKKSTAKKSPAKKPVVKKAAAAKPVAKKAMAAKTASKKAVAKKPVAKRPAAKTTAKMTASKKPIVHEAIKVFTRGLGKVAKNEIRPPAPPPLGTSLADRRRIGTEMQASFLSEKWSKVTLNARKTYSSRAQLYLRGASVFLAAVPRIIIEQKTGEKAFAAVTFDAPRVGDLYLIEFHVGVIGKTELEILADDSMKASYSSGNHAIRVVAEANFTGQQFVGLRLNNIGHSFELFRIEIQPLDS